MTSSALAANFRPAASVYARPFGDELVLLEFGRGEYFALDEIGAVVWRNLEAGKKLSEIAVEIATMYDVTKEVALVDIVNLVEEMESRALLERITVT